MHRLFYDKNIKYIVDSCILAVSLAVILSGCGISSVFPLADEERYQYINAVKDDLDYASAGEVLNERYDTGDGSFSPSFFYAELEGDEAFDLLEKRSDALFSSSCRTAVDLQIRCDVDGVDIEIKRKDISSEFVTLRITDTSSGRRENG